MSGADTIIIQHGINDIIHPVGVQVNPFRPWSDLPTAQELIDGLRMYVEKAREYGLKVHIGTLLPIYGWRTYEPFRNDLRNAVNEWIRTTDEIDGYIDFDAALRAADKPEAFAEGFDLSLIHILQIKLLPTESDSPISGFSRLFFLP